MPAQACFPASKVFSAMYPSITYLQGQAPAAAHVSAIAELGPLFAFVVIAMVGIAIGLTTGFARLCEPVLGAAMIAAVSVFAYNLTQVPFVGALTYSQGLVVFLFPVALIILVQSARPVISKLFSALLQNGRHRILQHSENDRSIG
jgi:hypothetical protein